MDTIKERIRKDADHILQLQHLDGDQGRLRVSESFLKKGHLLLLGLHRKGASGKEIVSLNAFLMDTFIQHLYDYALKTYTEKHGSWPYPISIIALGGYGRSELSPFSDVDIMFLYPHKMNPALIEGFLEHLSEKILYPLWDLKLKVGHSTRTITEAIHEAKINVYTKNSLLEARLISGSKRLFNFFQEKYTAFIQESDSKKEIEEFLAHSNLRRSKFSHTPFLQEPNIKNGVGGLRDYQNILWMVRVYWNIDSLKALLDQCYITENEYNQLTRAYDFLLSVRNEIHFQSDTASDILSLERQPQIAENLGYHDHDVFKRVEAFMRDYYEHTHNIQQIASFIETRLLRLSTTTPPQKFSFRNLLKRDKEVQETIDGFVLKEDKFFAVNENVFIENPIRLIRIYRYCQQYSATMDSELVRLIRNSLDLITQDVIRDEGANKCLRSILQTSGEVYPALFNMHAHGTLSAFLPEFAPLTHLVQHEHYHRYTADIHTLNTIRVLDNVFNLVDDEASQYAKAIRKTTRPSLLYLIMLLHDIGKSVGIKGHSKTGMDIAAPMLDRIGINPKQKEIVLFIIKNHLEMVRQWQRYDVDDPETAKNFADFVKDPELLHYLYVQTYCDAKGTAKDLWNSYKEILHTKLYRKTLACFDADAHYLTNRINSKKVAYNDLVKSIFPDFTEEQIQEDLALIPNKYFILFTPEEMQLHLSMLKQLYALPSDPKSYNSPIVHWKEDLDQSLTTVSIITRDHKGLFSELTGAFSAVGLNILSSKAITRRDAITIDTFYVASGDNQPIQNEKLRLQFRAQLDDIIIKHKDPLPAIIAQVKKASTPFAKQRDNYKLRAAACVNVYKDNQLGKIIIEVQGMDRIGLLYHMASAISDHDFSISFARITTEHGIAMDTFHIESLSDPTHVASRLIDLREALNKIVGASD